MRWNMEDTMIGNRSMRKRILLLMAAAVVGTQLSGCALTSEVSVPEEESGLIAEYAAGLLLKYDSKHENGLERIKEDPEEETSEEETGEEETDEPEKESYEVCDIYPEEAPGDMFFSMQASPGKDLMIVHFNLTNTFENEQLCDMVNNNILFRLIINGNERINEQTTILLNDLKQYQDTVAGYGMEDVVLVFEIAEGAQDNFQTLQLLVKNADVENTYTLQ